MTWDQAQLDGRTFRVQVATYEMTGDDILQYVATLLEVEADYAREQESRVDRTPQFDGGNRGRGISSLFETHSEQKTAPLERAEEDASSQDGGKHNKGKTPWQGKLAQNRSRTQLDHHGRILLAKAMGKVECRHVLPVPMVLA